MQYWNEKQGKHIDQLRETRVVLVADLIGLILLGSRRLVTADAAGSATKRTPDQIDWAAKPNYSPQMLRPQYCCWSRSREPLELTHYGSLGWPLWWDDSAEHGWVNYSPRTACGLRGPSLTVFGRRFAWRQNFFAAATMLPDRSLLL